MGDSNNSGDNIAHIMKALRIKFCHHCNKRMCHKRNCPKLGNGNSKLERIREHPGGKAGSRGGAGRTWCSFHNTKTHSDYECYTQGALRPQQGGAYAALYTQLSHPPLDGDDNVSELTFGNIATEVSVHMHNYCTDLSTQRSRNSNISGRLHYRARALSDPQTTQNNIRHYHHCCNDIVTIVRGLWELLNTGAQLTTGTPHRQRKISVRDLDQRAGLSVQQ